MARKWREVRGSRPLNETRVAAYSRLMEAEALLAQLCRRRGVTEAQLAEAAAAGEPTTSESEHGDLYLPALSRYVATLGGHIEVQAVFDDATLMILRTDQPDGGTGASKTP